LGIQGFASIVACKEHESGRHLTLRLVSERAPREINIQEGEPLSKLGEAYLPVETADVKVLKAPTS
jgi:hypothetical protein